MMLEAILVSPQRPMLPKDLTSVNLLAATTVPAAAATPPSADTTASEFTIVFRMKGLVTLMHFARIKSKEDFQKNPLVSLLKM